MHDARGWTGLQVLTVAAAVSTWAASDTTASPMSSVITYQTIGSVGHQAGNAGSPVIFRGVDDGSFVSSTPFSLGEFEVSPLARGAVDMPFVIAYRTKTVDGVVPSINETPVLLRGRLVGTLVDAGQSYLEAIFDQGPQFADPKYYNPRPAPPFRTGDLMNTIEVNGTQEFLTLTTTGGGRTMVEGRIDVTPVPEPTTLAVFAVAAVGIGLHRWFQFSR